MSLPSSPGEVELVALRPPVAEDRRDLRRRRALGKPRLDVGRPELERRRRELEHDVADGRARAGVRQHRRARLRLAVEVQAGEEARHRPAVAAEHPALVRAPARARAPSRPSSRPGSSSPAAPTSRRPSPARAHPPGRRPGTRPTWRDRRRSTRAGPSRATPPMSLCGSRPAVPANSSTRYASAFGACSVHDRARQPERREQHRVDVRRVRHPGLTRDDLAEQREREVRVVVSPRGRKDELVLLHRVEHLLDRRGLARHEHLPRLALKPRDVREHPPQRRRAVRDPRADAARGGRRGRACRRRAAA